LERVYQFGRENQENSEETMRGGDFNLGFALTTKHMYSIMLIERESPFTERALEDNLWEPR
jgi:hypothetical protein